MFEEDSKREIEFKELQKKLNTPQYKKKSTIEKKLQNIMGIDPVNDGFEVNLIGKDDHLDQEYQLFFEVFAQQKQHEGLYILLTTVVKEKMSTFDFFYAYKCQFGVEDSFRTLKNPLKIRPLFVHKTECLQVLIFIIMLALIVYSVLELLIMRNDLYYSLQRALQLLSSLVLVQLLLPDQELSFQIASLKCRNLHILNVFNWLTIHEWTLEKILHHYSCAIYIFNPSEGKKVCACLSSHEYFLKAMRTLCPRMIHLTMIAINWFSYVDTVISNCSSFPSST